MALVNNLGKSDLNNIIKDTHVPDIFICNYLTKLEALPIKVYLLSLLEARDHGDLPAARLCNLLNCSEADYKKALIRLSVEGLIDLEADCLNFKLRDLKHQALEDYLVARNIVTKEVQMPDERKLWQEANAAFMQDINKTFFQGMMNLSWYQSIEKVMELYKFENQVIYSLIKECAEKNKLTSSAYFLTVAESWHKRGIVTFQDLSLDIQKNRKNKELSYFVATNLNRVLSAKEIEMVAMWSDDFKFNKEIIKLALDKTPMLRTVTVNAIHRILSDWHNHNLTTVEAIKAYEAERQNQLQLKYKSGSISKRAGNTGNFSQRANIDVKSNYEKYKGLLDSRI